MRVVFLNQYGLPSGAAGITRHGDIGAELVSRGHHVTVVASDFDYFTRRGSSRVSASRDGTRGVKFIWLRTGSYYGNDRGRIQSMLRYAWAATRAVLRLHPSPDVIVGSSPHLLAPLAASIAARRIGVPWVFEARDFWPSALVDLGAVKRGGATHRLLERLEKYLYSSATQIVSVPPHGGQRLRDLGMADDKVTHIPNGTTLSEVRGEPIPSSLEAILQKVSSDFVVMYAGAIGATHDLKTAVTGMEALASDVGDARRASLVVIGDGVNRAETEVFVSERGVENVFFHTALPKAQVLTALGHADASLMQIGTADYFKYGLSPNKLFDYFAAGLPVLIASKYPTVADQEGAGIRFEPGSAADFERAVLRLVQMKPAERHEMGERGRELARGPYSISALADAYEELLMDLVR